MAATLAEEVGEYDSRVSETLTTALHQPLEAWQLDEGLEPGGTNRIGYTLKALGAGFWAMLHATTFEDGVLRVVHEGGDADTNASVAGALLGARFGYDAIPARWSGKLVDAAALEERVSRLLARVPEWHS